LIFNRVKVVLSANEVAFHPALVDLATFVDLFGVAGDEKVRVQLKDLLLCGEKELLRILKKKTVAGGKTEYVTLNRDDASYAVV
jgi:hypothetical protein